MISLVLAHLLKPSDYGLIGMMAVFTELLASVFDWTIGPAVVHFYEEGKTNEIPQYFTFSFLLGVAFTLLLIFSAPLIADFYHEPRLTEQFSPQFAVSHEMVRERCASASRPDRYGQLAHPIGPPILFPRTALPDLAPALAAVVVQFRSSFGNNILDAQARLV